jgi:hypothetical protein
MTDGLAVYLGSGDMAAIERGKGPQLSLLKRCGATMAMVLCESVDGRRQSSKRFAAVCAALRSIDVVPIGYSFPNLEGDLVETALHFTSCAPFANAMQWDLEPHAGNHWTPKLLAPLLALDPHASITSTRVELPHLGDHGREVWLQLEAQTSLDTLDSALRKAPDAVLVTGLFDGLGNPRELREVKRDLERAAPQAQRIGKHAVWSLQSMSVSEADALREWALSVWGVRAA